jgi:hypothetical protein
LTKQLPVDSWQSGEVLFLRQHLSLAKMLSRDKMSLIPELGGRFDCGFRW